MINGVRAMINAEKDLKKA